MVKINSSGLVDIFLDRYFVWKDCKQFYHRAGPAVATKDKSGIPVFHYQDINSINSCNSDVVIIDCLTEGIHSTSEFNQYNPDKHYIIFANGFWIKEQHPEIKINYDLVDSYYFLWDMVDTYSSPARFCYYVDKDYNFDYPKNSVFTSTIGNVKSYRTSLVDKLKTLSYDNFILRYSGQDHGMKSNDLDVVEFNLGEFDPYTLILDKHYHNVSQTVPIDLYNQSYFNLVVETDIEYTDSFFPTEKIIKTLFTGMPFVLVATPYFLKNLHKLGFTTYNEFWDESYDLELDHNRRIDKIVDLCQQLEHFDWNKHRLAFELVKLKNRNNFFNLNGVVDKEFENFENIFKGLKL